MDLNVTPKSLRAKCRGGSTVHVGVVCRWVVPAVGLGLEEKRRPEATEGGEATRARCCHFFYFDVLVFFEKPTRNPHTAPLACACTLSAQPPLKALKAKGAAGRSLC